MVATGGSPPTGIHTVRAMHSRVPLQLLIAAFVLPLTLVAQDADSLDITGRRAPRGAFGIHAFNGQPVGDFGRAVNTSWGAAADIRFFLDRAGFLAVRLDGGMAGYGRSRGEASFGFLGGGRVTTQNTYAFALAGLEVAQPDGPIRPYVNASIGTSVFTTNTTADDAGFWDDRRRRNRSRTLVDDWVRTSAVGGGIRFAINDGSASRTMLDIGVRRWFTGPVTYATREDVMQGPSGPTVRTRRSAADQWALTIGFSITR